MEHKTKSRSKHMGRKIGRMHELLGVKQDIVADKLGISQQTVSKIEQSENVDDEMLEKMAKALGVNVEAIKSFDEESIVYNIIQNNYEGATNNTHSENPQYQCTFSPIDKLMEVVEENKKLYKELLKEKEAVLKSEKEKVAMLQKILDEKK